MTDERDRKRSQQRINLFRRSSGLTPLDIKERSCMKCQREFESEGHHNRLCSSCRNLRTHEGYDYMGIDV